MKLEKLKIMYNYVGNNYFQLKLILKTSGESDFGSNGYGRKDLDNFIENKCPETSFNFAGGFGSNDVYDMIYRAKTLVPGNENTITILGPYATNKVPIAFDQETFEPENPNETTYQLYQECIKNIQEHIGKDIINNLSIMDY